MSDAIQLLAGASHVLEPVKVVSDSDSGWLLRCACDASEQLVAGVVGRLFAAAGQTQGGAQQHSHSWPFDGDEVCKAMDAVLATFEQTGSTAVLYRLMQCVDGEHDWCDAAGQQSAMERLSSLLQSQHERQQSVAVMGLSVLTHGRLLPLTKAALLLQQLVPREGLLQGDPTAKFFSGAVSNVSRMLLEADPGCYPRRLLSAARMLQDDLAEGHSGSESFRVSVLACCLTVQEIAAQLAQEDKEAAAQLALVEQEAAALLARQQEIAA